MDLNFYKNKKVLVTGHTGFKGSWMSCVRVNFGAQVIGYSSCSETEERLFDLCGIKNQMSCITCCILCSICGKIFAHSR